MSLRNRVAVPYHWGQGVVAGMKNGWPGRELTVVGVTGTNGKTTTCFMIWKMLNESGRRAAVMTTVAWGVDKLQIQEEHMSTMPTAELNRRIREVVEEGVEYLVLEMTSHALQQYRAVGVPIEVAVVTNITHEHLDYHGTLENYVAAKKKLFEKAKYGVVNADDGVVKDFKGVAREDVTYGIEKGKIRATDVKLGAEGVEYEVDGMRVKTRIPGRFNVYNSLAAVAVGRRLGLTDDEITKGVYALTSVSGRMERVDEGQNFEVIVDYAHTPDAMDKVYESIGKVKGRIITVFGGAGRRDVSSRGMRGEIAAKYSDLLVVTEDDTRDEDVWEIMEQIAKGARAKGMHDEENMWLVKDRREAVRKAFGLAKKGDVVLLLGKGHERTILLGDEAVPYFEPEVAMEELRALKK